MFSSFSYTRISTEISSFINERQYEGKKDPEIPKKKKEKSKSLSPEIPKEKKKNSCIYDLLLDESFFSLFNYTLDYTLNYTLDYTLNYISSKKSKRKRKYLDIYDFLN